MALTFGEFRELIAPYSGRAGRCASDPSVRLFARQVMELLLNSGAEGSVMEVRAVACDGMVSLPPEVEVPLKVKVNNRVTEVWDHAATFHSGNIDSDKCLSWGEAFIEDGNRTPLDYAFPKCGALIAIQGNCKEDDDCVVYIQGKDTVGKEIYSTWKGEQITGVKFQVEKGKLKYSEIEFGQVTSVVKSKSNGYVSAYAVHSTTKRILRFLADWAPSEEKPSRRRYRLLNRSWPERAELSILCSVRLKDNYTDQEVTLFDNSLAVMLAAQSWQGEINNDSQTADYKGKRMDNILEREAGNKKKSGTPADIYFPMSGGSIKNCC